MKRNKETSKQISSALKTDDGRKLVTILDNLKGSRAVEYVLAELIGTDSKVHKHTIASLLLLIRAEK